MTTYIFTVRQLVEVKHGNGREAAIEILRLHPPCRKLNGCGFSIKTRDEIEVLEEQDELPGLRREDEKEVAHHGEHQERGEAEMDVPLSQVRQV